MNGESILPTWNVGTNGNPLVPIQFENIYEIRDAITEIAVGWPTNSYYLNLKEKYFVINGGKKLKPSGFDVINPKLFYAKRHIQTMTVGTDKIIKKLNYLIGYEGENENGDKRVILIQISEDGLYWTWRNAK